MIHKVYILQGVSLIAIVVFILITLYVLYKGNKRDKNISIGLLTLSIVLYVVSTVKINLYIAKAEKFYGNYELSHYNNSSDYSIEILPDRLYKLYNKNELINTGNWDLSIDNDELPLLLINGEIFGVDDLEIIKRLPK